MRAVVRGGAARCYASGTGNGKFESELSITREELAVTLWNLSGKPTSTGTLNDFTDGAAVSSWAQAAMRRAIETGILSGKGNGVLDPAGTATRAEAAALLQNYLRK